MRQKVVAVLGILVAVAISFRWHKSWDLSTEIPERWWLFGDGSYASLAGEADTIWLVDKVKAGVYRTGGAIRLAEWRGKKEVIWSILPSKDAVEVTRGPIVGRLHTIRFKQGDRERKGLLLDAGSSRFGLRCLIPLGAGLWGLFLLVWKKKKKVGSFEPTNERS